MDFLKIKERSPKEGKLEIYPDYSVKKSQDLMVRAKSFYAIWDEEANLWSQNEYDVPRLVDKMLREYKGDADKRTEGVVQVKYLGDFSSSSWLQFRNYIGHLSDSSTELDEKLTFSNTEVTKSDYVSRRLPYPLSPGDTPAWNEIMGTLYHPEERQKLEWAIGAIVSGDSKRIQKFIVLYGAPGTGKGTFLDIVGKLFDGYIGTFEAKTLTGNGAFAAEAFKHNPLVAIDPDGDLSRLQDNTRLNSIVSHEPMMINEKNKPTYSMKVHAFLMIATNMAIKFTDAKSGLIRRLIDVHPSGETLSARKYQTLTNQVDFELGAIAHHCLEVYRSMGKNYYDAYRPTEMMLQTDVFFNFIEAYYEVFKSQNGVSLQQAHVLYNEFCDDSGLEYKLARHKIREELKNYFDKYEERATIDGARVRSWYSEFNAEHFKYKVDDEPVFSLVMDSNESLLDDILKDCPAQLSNASGYPRRYWTDAPKKNKEGVEFTPKPSQVCDTFLKDLDTTKEHYVKPPQNHIVIDFDLTDDSGEKSAELNLEAASQWPPTYAEFSKSGGGIHLHYDYDGDANTLSRIFEEGIEIKVFTGDMSLRRRVSKCNNVPVATLNSGLPIKEKKKVIDSDQVQSEKALRDLVTRCINREFNGGNTKPSVDFIHKILGDAYLTDLQYDLTDMRGRIMSFANNSSNQALYCLKLVQDMKFKSEDVNPNPTVQSPVKDQRVVIFDVEVFPNLFVICWKFEGADQKMVKMINPTAQMVGELLELRLVGFNVRRYDNHILYAAFMGYNNQELYELSKKIISGTPGAMFGSAYSLSYADIYDYASKKQGLKKWQLELDLHHQESQHDFDKPVPEDKWNEIVDYCCNDVLSTEAVFENRRVDFIARQILADLSGLPVNEPTRLHASKIVFGEDRKPQSKFIYTKLSEMFPGYEYDHGTSTYKGEVTGEGGYVYSEPGMYHNVALLDVESMHPASIEAMNMFGEYTKNFSDVKRARMAIKHKDFNEARTMLNGRLAKYLVDESQAKDLSNALKLVINSVYGLTAARFDNSFKDPRNIDNIVAKRGALFMVDLKEAVQNFVGKNGERFTVAHIKTDSIKIPDATPEIIAFVMAFGEKYGYTFQHEATYEKMTLVNDAVYIAKVGWAEDESKIGTWEATGAQFAHPYVYKTLFSREPIVFKDLCETKSVTTALYLDFTDLDRDIAMVDEKLHFVGKAGKFTPILPGRGGALLMREKAGSIIKSDKVGGFDLRESGMSLSAATGSKGYYWLESEMVKSLGKEKDIDKSYFEVLTNEALDKLAQFGDTEAFCS